mgnify:CR=1 FL=1
MISIEKCEDNLDKVAEIINKSGYKEWLSNNKYIENPDILRNEYIVFYLLKNDNETIGFLAFNNKIKQVSIIDLAILDRFRGKIGKDASILGINNYIENSDCKVIISRIDKENKRAIVFSSWVGFKKYSEDDKFIYVRKII